MESPLERRPILLANPGADLYGSDRMLLETVSSLVTLGEQVIVTVPSAGPLISEIAKRGGQTVITPTPIIRKSALRPTGMLSLVHDILSGVLPGLTLLARVRPRLVLVNTVTPPLWLLLAKALRIPTAAHIHEAEASVSRCLRRGLSLPLLLADQLIVNSRFTRTVLADTMPHLAKRSRVAYNAVPGPSVRSAARQALTGRVRLLYVGRLSPRKGPDVAVEALKILIARGIDAELDLVGAPFTGYEWFEDQLRRTVAEFGLTDRVTFHGFQYDVWPLIARSDIGVIPSVREESFGNTAVEMALGGRPFVVSNTSGLIEASDGVRACVRVEPGSGEQIADAVETIVSRWPEYAAAAALDAESTADRYSIDRYRDSLAMIIRDHAHDDGFGVALE